MKMVYDVIGIGIGPFNLGLAALCDDVPNLKTLFFDGADRFDWHPGLMLEDARLQVPFYADLVTVVDPCNRFSYLNFLKSKQRLFRFAIHENYFTTRKEYNHYCQWVVSQLPNLHFGCKVLSISANPADGNYCLQVLFARDGHVRRFYAKRIVLGTGTQPSLPSCVPQPLPDGVLHSGDYLFRKEAILKKGSATVVGSGQSAAEIFYDLLKEVHRFPDGLNWITRSERFYPMEYSKLTLEMSSPDYIAHFYSLAPQQKRKVLAQQPMLYKGINFDLINAIYDELYRLQLDGPLPIQIQTNCELQDVIPEDGVIGLVFEHLQLKESFFVVTDSVILATGYSYQVPAFVEGIRDRILWDGEGRYAVNEDYSIDAARTLFVQNAELHTHGFSAPDLGMGPYRNAVILNTILGVEYFKLEKGIAFQRFGV